MRKRIRTSESMVQLDVRTGQHYLLAAVRIEIFRQIPDDVDRDRTRMYVRELDATFGEGLQDLIGRFWVPVPPIQFRIDRRPPGDFFGVYTAFEVHERRVRVVKPILTAINLEATNPVLNVPFTVDWDSREHGWQVYIPEYDDETEAQRSSQAPPPSTDASSASGDRQAGPSGTRSDREGASTDAPPQLRP